MLHATSAVKLDEHINTIVYIENETESAELSCGEIPENAVAIYWSVKNSSQWRNILRFYPTKPSINISYYAGYTADKYGISKSVNTSLVVKGIDLSVTNLFRCSAGGLASGYGYISLLKVKGKYCLVYSTLHVSLLSHFFLIKDS